MQQCVYTLNYRCFGFEDSQAFNRVNSTKAPSRLHVWEVWEQKTYYPLSCKPLMQYMFLYCACASLPQCCLIFPNLWVLFRSLHFWKWTFVLPGGDFWWNQILDQVSLYFVSHVFSVIKYSVPAFQVEFCDKKPKTDCVIIREAFFNLVHLFTWHTWFVWNNKARDSSQKTQFIILPITWKPCF